jgi:hypothetical protein
MNKERIRLIYLTMLCVSLIVFCFSLFILLQVKEEDIYKTEYNKSIESIKNKPISK